MHTKRKQNYPFAHKTHRIDKEARNKPSKGLLLYHWDNCPPKEKQSITDKINGITHMEIKNLTRAAEIADELPRLEKAKKMLSKMGNTTRVTVEDIDSVVELPHSMNLSIISVLNIEINSLREEAKKL